MEVQRGDVVIVELDPTRGSEQGKTRPAVVVQNDVGNQYSPTTIVAPITSSYGKVYPVNVELRVDEEDVDRNCVVLLNQLRVVSIEHRIVDVVGHLSEMKMTELDEALAISVGLKPP